MGGKWKKKIKYGEEEEMEEGEEKGKKGIKICLSERHSYLRK